jgi:hypothetical protein
MVGADRRVAIGHPGALEQADCLEQIKALRLLKQGRDQLSVSVTRAHLEQLL